MYGFISNLFGYEIKWVASIDQSLLQALVEPRGGMVRFLGGTRCSIKIRIWEHVPLYLCTEVGTRCDLKK